MVKYVIVFDKPFDDTSTIGPFEDWSEAIAYGDTNIFGGIDWHLSDLEEPQ